MPAAKGRVKPVGSGRKKGVANHASTKSLRDAVLASFWDDRVGGIDYLVKQASDNPKAYLLLLAKIIPSHLQVDPSEGGVTSITIKRISTSDPDKS